MLVLHLPFAMWGEVKKKKKLEDKKRKKKRRNYLSFLKYLRVALLFIILFCKYAFILSCFEDSVIRSRQMLSPGFLQHSPTSTLL